MNRLLKSVVLFLACISAGAAFAQEPYPSRPTRILVGFQAGGSVDLTARLIATHLAPLLGTPVLVENKLGASGIIAAGEVARSAPDGYTLFMANLGSSALAPNMQPTLPFDPVNDFTAIGQIAAVSYLAVIPASIPPNNLKEFIAWAKQRGDVPYASAGVGATGHMNGELLNQVAGLTMRHVPYKGAPQALTELISGQTFLYIDPNSVLKPHVKAGKLKALYITSLARDPELPDVPTVRELGHPDLETSGWQGLVGPKGIPDAVVTRLYGELRKVLAMPEVRDRLAASGQPVKERSPAEFAAFIKSENERVLSVITKAKMRAE